MTVETETHLTLKEYVAAGLRLFYERPLALILQIISFASLPFVILWAIHIIDIQSTGLIYALLYLGAYSITCPIYVAYSMRKQYKSSMASANTISYTFNDNGISYKAGGMDGRFEWKYILKYSIIQNVLALYMTARGVIFIKIDKLTDEEINFIVSKIDETKV